MPIITIRVPAELHERFLAMCEKRDMKPSEFGRRAIEAIVDHAQDSDGVALNSMAHPSSGFVAPNREPSPLSIQRVPITKTPRLTPSIRGFALDGSPLEAKHADRLKKSK